MTTRTPKPKKSPAPLLGIAIATTAKPQFEVTPDEARLIQVYRQMRDIDQEAVQKIAQIFMVKNPRPKQPALRLVKGVKS